MQKDLGEIEMDYYVGVDIGTTSTKSVLFNKEGDVVKSAYREYPLYSNDTMMAEQDPFEILQAVVETLREVVVYHEKCIKLISFSSAMHSVIAVDKDGKPLTRCITWADKRSTMWANKIKDDMNGLEIHKRTGTPIHPMSPLTKLLWLKNEHREIFDKTSKFIGIKEFIFYHFFGKYIVDYSIASATGMMNLEQLKWDKEVLQLIGISEERLSELVPTTTIVKEMNDKYLNKIGLLPDTKIIIGASDGVLSNLGVGAIEKGIIAITIGTSGAVRTVVNKPTVDKDGKVFCYMLTDNYWIIGGAVNNGGIILRWLRDEIASEEVRISKELDIDSYDMITELAESVNAGAEGLLFHPFLTGERAPIWNADARGSLFGLSIHHKKEHIIRAVMEGVLFNLLDVLVILEEQIVDVKQIQATGGFARSRVWRQMMSDVFNQKVVIPEIFESSCLGAVILGMYATKEIDDLSEVSKFVGKTFEHVPNEENSQIYQKLYPIYKDMLKNFEKGYSKIAEFQKSM